MQRSRDLLKGPMGDDAVSCIDPRSGKSPPPAFSVSYATTMPSYRLAGQGAEGVSPRYGVAASSLGPKTLKTFTVLPLVALL
jgi:hypothetical protein